MEKTTRTEKRKRAIRRVLARWFDHRKKETGNKKAQTPDTATDTPIMEAADRKEPVQTDERKAVADKHRPDMSSPEPEQPIQAIQKRSNAITAPLLQAASSSLTADTVHLLAQHSNELSMPHDQLLACHLIKKDQGGRVSRQVRLTNSIGISF